MRPLLEILSLFALIMIGWNRPYSEQTAMVFPWMGPLAVTATPSPAPQFARYPIVAARPVATPLDRNWIFGPSRLDPPAHK